jgi:hypothetical protein
VSTVPRRLLERQLKLLDYLTSSEAIFGEARDKPLDPVLQGIDPALLQIEARFSHEKRMEKITAVFPRTFELLGHGRDKLVKEFTDACPPVDITRLENARAFHEFLLSRWNDEPPRPPYLPDVAACELAFAGVRAAADSVTGIGDPAASPGTIRRRPDLILLRTAYDIRPLFEQSSQAPRQRDTVLAITLAAAGPRVAEVAPELFGLLDALEQWTDPSTFGAVPQGKELIAELVRSGLIEVCG